ncbi:hypothetical protein ACSVBT_04230 [Afipia sp. TerB]
MRMKTFLFVTSLIGIVPTLVLAQAPPSPATPSQQTAPPNPARQQQNCAPTQARPNEGTITPHGSTTGQSNEPLGERLARSDGVLCPPSGVDPEIHTPAPNTGTMPVIPPPGSPGGDQNVRPK